MTTPAQRAEIWGLFYAEHRRVGTIAAQLGLHHETVRAAVERETGGFRRAACRPSILDPYLPFIRDTARLVSISGRSPSQASAWRRVRQRRSRGCTQPSEAR